MLKQTDITTPEQDAKLHAISVANGKFGNQTTRLKINKDHYRDVNQMTYLLAVVNAYKDMLQLIKSNIDIPTEEFQGEIETRLKDSWGWLCETKLGRQTFVKMEIEDIIYGTDVKCFVKNKKALI